MNCSLCIFMILAFAYGQYEQTFKDTSSNKLHIEKHFTTLESKPIYVSRSLNSRQQIRLPFERLFAISTSLQSSMSNSIVNFSPTSFKLSHSKQSMLIDFEDKIQKQKSQNQSQENSTNFLFKQLIIEDLRTPFPRQAIEIVIVNQSFIFVFVFPQKVIILEQMKSFISIKRTYIINQIKQKHQTMEPFNQSITPETISFYPFFNSYVLGYLQNTNEILLFQTNGYFFLKNQANISNLQHIYSWNSTDLSFFTAEKQNGFKHCKINLSAKTVELVKKFYLISSIGLQINEFLTRINLQIYDISYNSESNQIYLLDINLGVIAFNYSQTFPNQQSKFKSILIIKQQGCLSLDYLHNDRIILICQERRKKFFIESYYDSVSRNYIKQPPIFHNSNFEDLLITSQFYLAFQSSSIDVFWPSKTNFIPELVHNKKHFNLLGVQAYRIVQDINGEIFLYSIRNNILFKQKLEEQQYSLNVGSSHPLIKIFILQAFGSCQNLYFNLKDKKEFSTQFDSEQIKKINLMFEKKSDLLSKKAQNQFCQLKVLVELEASRYIFENRSKFALGIVISVICVLIAFTLICICSEKYRGMHKNAQQTLKKLEKQQAQQKKQFFGL